MNKLCVYLSKKLIFKVEKSFFKVTESLGCCNSKIVVLKKQVLNLIVSEATNEPIIKATKNAIK